MHIFDLPLEILLRIFNLLPTRTRVAAATVSKLWNEISDHDILWKGNFLSHFGRDRLVQSAAEHVGFKEKYKQEIIVLSAISCCRVERLCRARALTRTDLQLKHIFCTFFGDPRVGKTTLCNILANHMFLADYVPTLTEDRYTVLTSRAAERFAVQLCDSGQDWSETRVRKELLHNDHSGALKSADVLALVFDVTRRETLTALIAHWGPLLQRCCPDAPLLLVANCSDRRTHPPELAHVTSTEIAEAVLLLNAAAFVECSACTRASALDVLEALVRTVCPLLPMPVYTHITRPKVYADSDMESLSDDEDNNDGSEVDI